MNLWAKVKRYPRLSLILLAFIAFVALGLPDGLLGVGWPSIRTGFSVPLDAIGMLLAASVAGYMTSSFLSGFLLSRVGVGRVLVFSCFLTGLALIGYTLAPQWWMMVLLGVFAGLGAGAIDAGLNTYVAANFGVDLSIAPIFPAMISGTKTRVGDRYAANTIGMQMAATGFGTAVIPSLMGVLARQISLEVIPVCLLATYAGLSGFYVLAMGHWKKQAVTNLEQLYENPS